MCSFRSDHKNIFLVIRLSSMVRSLFHKRTIHKYLRKNGLVHPISPMIPVSPRCFFHIFVQIFFLHVSPCLLISCCWRHGVVMLTHRDFSLSHFLSKDALDGPSRISWNQMRLHHHFCSLLSAWFHREQTCGTCTSETRGARAPAHDGLTLW